MHGPGEKEWVTLGTSGALTPKPLAAPGFAEPPGQNEVHNQAQGVGSETQVGQLPKRLLPAEQEWGWGCLGMQLYVTWYMRNEWGEEEMAWLFVNCDTTVGIISRHVSCT